MGDLMHRGCLDCCAGKHHKQSSKRCLHSHNPPVTGHNNIYRRSKLLLAHLSGAITYWLSPGQHNKP